MADAVRIGPVAPADGPRRVEPILRSVPEWFGIEEATRMYIDAAGRMPTWIACLDGPDGPSRDAGFLTVARHFPRAADVFGMAVHRDFHGRGVGAALVAHVEALLRADGVEYLQVKTLGPSRPNAGYARTRHFYERCGFTPLEEIHGLWPGNPCLILVKRL